MKQQQKKSRQNKPSPQKQTMIFVVLIALGIVLLFLSLSNQSKEQHNAISDNNPLSTLAPDKTGNANKTHETADREETAEGISASPQPDKYRASIVTYTGQSGQYTFGSEAKDSNIEGICLNPSYSEATKENQVGFLLTPIGCNVWTPATSNTTCADEVVYLNPNKALSDQQPIKYLDTAQYGAMWVPDLFFGDFANQESSSVYIRTIDLSKNIILDIFELHFGQIDSKEYKMLYATNPIETDPIIIQAAKKELNKMIGIWNEPEPPVISGLDQYLTQPEPQPYLPLKTNIDFLSTDNYHTVFVHKVTRPYGDYYVSTTTQKQMSKGWLAEHKDNLYAVSVNLGGASGPITLYMTSTQNNNGEIEMQTQGYEQTKIF